jgi:hypothetical protein
MGFYGAGGMKKLAKALMHWAYLLELSFLGSKQPMERDTIAVLPLHQTPAMQIKPP